MEPVEPGAGAEDEDYLEPAEAGTEDAEFLEPAEPGAEEIRLEAPAVEEENLPAVESDAGAEARPATSQAAEVEAAIRSWRRAWEARALADYLGAYVAEDRLPPRRVQNVENKDRIEVRMDDLQVTELGTGLYEAEFVQTYCGFYPEGGALPWFGSKVAKRMELTSIDGGWKISREEVTRVLEEPACD